MKYILPTILLVLILSFGVNIRVEASSQGVLEVTESQAEFDLVPYMDLLEDTNNSLTIDDIKQADQSGLFTEHATQTPNYGYSAPTHWVKVQVRNQSNEQEWLLKIGYPPLDRIDLYIARPDNTVLLKQSGDAFSFKSREVKNRNFTFKIPMEPNQQVTLYLRVQTEGAMAIPMKLVKAVRYAERELSSYLLLGGYYGLMLIMTLYNSFLAFSLRSKAFYYYVGINASTLFLYLTLNGIAFEYIWPDAVWWNNRAIVFFMCLSHIAALFFARNFLDLKNRFNKLYHMFTLFIAVEVANVFILFINYPLGLQLSIYSIMVIEIFIILTGIISLRGGFKPAIYFVLGWGVFMVGAMLTALADAGFIPIVDWTIYSSQVGSTFEAVILSWGLADHIHSIRKEKEFAVAQMKESRRLADSDPLTGLFNRRYVIDLFDSTVKSGIGKPISLMMLDVDHFKQVNDTYGHDTGDLVLQQLADILQECFRPTDIVGRFGGEEFMVLLKDTNMEQARSAAEYLLHTIREHKFVAINVTLHCTVSIGISEWNVSKEEDFHQMLRRADESLYEAKNSGRDRVCVAPKSE